MEKINLKHLQQILNKLHKFRSIWGPPGPANVKNL